VGHLSLERRLRAFPRQALHARELQFVHPESGETLTLTAPLPDDFAELMDGIRQALGGDASCLYR
jgi:23S rRNA pseudouridine1911/1915/1917 synthase